MTKMTGKAILVGLCIGAAALGLDQVSKELATSYATSIVDGLPLLPGFNLVFLRNDGLSFGMFDGMPPWLLITLALAICGWLLATMFRTQSRTEAMGCGMIIGGALGNVFDRIRYGAVTDFLDFYAGTWHWPAFNLADTAILGGVALLILHSLLGVQGKQSDG